MSGDLDLHMVLGGLRTGPITDQATRAMRQNGLWSMKWVGRPITDTRK